MLSNDVTRSTEAIRAHSAADGGRYPEFVAALERLGAFLLRLLEQTPPSLEQPGRQEIWELLKTGRQFRKLGRTDAFRLLRWMPMAAADLVGEWFTGDLLQAVVASRGIFGAAAGPWSGGTGAALLLNAAIDPVPGGSTIAVKGGPGALTHAMAEAAREAGATIRLDAPVARIAVANGRAQGVVLQDGSEMPASAVISNADPRRTLLALVDPIELDPGVLQRLRNYRMPGTVAKVNLTLGNCRPSSASPIPRIFTAAFTSVRASITSKRRTTRRSTARSPRSRTSTSPSRRCSIPNCARPTGT